ncbi:MAG: Muramoyltetrapeptide carboxypeptidase [Myxococcales bacterium]|nr:Muramoyltetrapeptide carboxypeptidase [Myxococcales bacterium]
MKRPARLRPGARVAVVAPAGPVPREPFAAGAAILGARYQLVHEERIFARNGYLAGGDDERHGELAAALADPTVDAVVCARGGYGLTRILDRLDAAAFARAPKLIIGFSDVTVLHAWAQRAGVISLHAPVVTQLGLLSADDAAALFALVESPAPPPPIGGLRALAGGRAEGRLVGGNLEMVTRLIGTPWALDLDGAVLLIEEVGERPYRIDRQLTHLKMAGALAGLAGVVVGDLVGCAEKDGGAPDAEAVIVERLGGLGVPVVADAPIGHGSRNRAVPHGARVRLDAASGVLEFLEGAVD